MTTESWWAMSDLGRTRRLEVSSRRGAQAAVYDDGSIGTASCAKWPVLDFNESSKVIVWPKSSFIKSWAYSSKNVGARRVVDVGLIRGGDAGDVRTVT